MPTYEYRCDACGHELEEFQSMSAKPLKKCPECGKNKLKRLIGIGAGVIFKGSGFYETDYRSGSYNEAAKAEKESAKKADTPSSDSKTETKSESKKSDTPSKSENTTKKPESKPKAQKKPKK
jgi:putative FmdB family regulatory protein